ncbi:MAG: substrate-binding domain-containing protein, partial [Saccharothrix sp.]|nr:substrate-binding domain-containing protein [Saccharothrix sp.]
FASNDLQALGAYHAAGAAGLRVPRDLSVGGFDDQPFTQRSDPPLTTVRQPLAQMGATAAEFVLALADGRPVEHERLELPTKLIVRGSTAAPPMSP